MKASNERQVLPVPKDVPVATLDVEAGISVKSAEVPHDVVLEGDLQVEAGVSHGRKQGS